MRNTRKMVPLLLALSLASAMHASGETVGLEELLQEAVRGSPSLQAADERWNARRQVRGRVTSLPDPRLELGFFLDSVETRVGPQKQSIGLSQRFPLGGKLPLRGAIADTRARVAKERRELARLNIVAAVKKLYYTRWFTMRSRDITKEMMDLIVSGERVARTRYTAGRSGQEDIIKAQVELGVLEDRLQTLEELEPTYVEDLNALLDRPPGTELGRPDPGDLVELEISVELDELFQLARELGPEIRGVLMSAEAKALEERLARKARVPDLSMGIKWIRTEEALMPTPDSGKDPLMFTLSVNLPLRRRRYRAEEKERRHERAALLQTAEQLQNSYEAALKRAYYEYSDGRRKIRLFRDSLIPKGRQSLEATFTSFQAGRASFLDVLDAVRVLLNFELSEAEATAVHLKQIAEIERLVAKTVSRRVQAP